MVSLSALYDFSKLDNIEIFLILDNDKHASDIQDKLKMKIKDENTFIWTKDFEYNNFGPTKTLEIINKEINLKNLIPIDEHKILEIMDKKKTVLMNAKDEVMKDKNGDKLQNFLSKKKLTEFLISTRVAQIEKERIA